MASAELPDLRVYLLGGLRVTLAGRKVDPPLPGRAQLLLAYELLHDNASRAAVGNAIAVTANAQESPKGHLDKAARELRRALGEGWVPRHWPQILAARPWVDLDALAAMEDEPAIAYCQKHGELLEGFPDLEWVRVCRAEHYGRLMSRLVPLIRAYRQAERPADATRLLKAAYILLPNDHFELVAAAARSEPVVSSTLVSVWPHGAEPFHEGLRRATARLDEAEARNDPSLIAPSEVTGTLELVLEKLRRAAWNGRFYPSYLVDAAANLLVRAEVHGVDGVTAYRLPLALVRDAYGGYRTALNELAPLLESPSQEVSYWAGVINMNFGRLDVAEEHLDAALADATDPLTRLRAREVRDLWLPSYRGKHRAVIAAAHQLLKDPDARELPVSARSGIVWRLGIAGSHLGEQRRAYQTLQLADRIAADPPNPHRPRVIAQVAREAGEHATYEREWHRFYEILNSSIGLGLWPHYRLAEARRRSEKDPYSSNPNRDLSFALADANEALGQWRQAGYLHGYCEALIQRGIIQHKLQPKSPIGATDAETALRLAGHTQLDVGFQSNTDWLTALKDRQQELVRRAAQEQANEVWSSFFDGPAPAR